MGIKTAVTVLQNGGGCIKYDGTNQNWCRGMLEYDTVVSRFDLKLHYYDNFSN